MHQTIGPEARRPLVIKEAQLKMQSIIARKNRAVSRVCADRRPRAPQQIPTDPSLVGNKCHTEIRTEFVQICRSFDPPLRRDQEVALRSRG